MNKIKRFLKIFLYTFISKKTLITIIIVLLLLLLKNNVQAVELGGVTYPDFPSSVANYEYYVISNDTRINRKHLIISSQEFTMSIDTNNSSKGSISSAGDNIHIYDYSLNNNNWSSLIELSSGTGVTYLPANIIYSSFDVKNSNGDVVHTSDATPPPPPEPIEPYITDTLLNLTNLNISNIVVDSGNQLLVDNEIIFKISTRPKGSPIGNTVYSTVLNPSSEFYNSNGVNGAYYEIPVEIFKDFLTAGYEITYYLEWRLIDTPAQRDNSEITVVYNPDAETVDDIELLNANLNSNFNKLNNTIVNNFNNLSTQQQQMIVQQQEANDTAKDTNQFLKNGNFDNSNLNLPTSQGDDITQDGINNIFTIIYNSFTSGQASDIIVPIPFTGKSFTIPSNYLRNILNGTQFTFISNIIELFWWYIISRFIVKDIAKKMNKLKSGDLENLENSNIKEEML